MVVNIKVRDIIANMKINTNYFSYCKYKNLFEKNNTFKAHVLILSPILPKNRRDHLLTSRRERAHLLEPGDKRLPHLLNIKMEIMRDVGQGVHPNNFLRKINRPGDPINVRIVVREGWGRGERYRLCVTGCEPPPALYPL